MLDPSAQPLASVRFRVPDLYRVDSPGRKAGGIYCQDVQPDKQAGEMLLYSVPLDSTSPVWLSEPYQPRPVLSGRHTCDVAVLGGGIVGVSTAYFLARDSSARVVLLEGQDIASGATGRNAGFLSSEIAAEYERWCADAQQRKIARRILHIGQRNRELVRDIITSHRIECAHEQKGIVWGALDEEGLRVAERSYRALQEDGYPTEWLTDTDIQKLYPHARGLLGGYLLPDHSTLHSGQYVRGLASVAEELGATIYEGSLVQSFDATNDGVRLDTPDGRLDCSSVVLACNAYLPLLLPNVSSVIRAHRAQMIATTASPLPLLPIPFQGAVSSSSVQVEGIPSYYGRALPDGRIIFGGGRAEAPETERVHALDSTTIERVQEAIGVFLGKYFPEIARLPVTHRWGGPMALTPDKRPLVGAFPGTPHTFIAAGMNGNGMGAYGTISAKMVADLLLQMPEKDHPYDLFDPGRLLA